MVYKSIQWLIKKEELINNSIVHKNFFLEEENKTIVKGVAVYIDNNKPAGNALVALQESIVNNNCYIDKYLAFADEEGNFLISFTPEEDKNYRIMVYMPSTK